LMASLYIDRLKFEKALMKNMIKYEDAAYFELGNLKFENKKIVLLMNAGGVPVKMTLSFSRLEDELAERAKLNIFETAYEIVSGKASKVTGPENPVKHKMILSINKLPDDEKTLTIVKKIFGNKKEIKCTFANFGSFYELWDNESFDKSRLNLKWPVPLQ
jgi:hypothetical protein